MDHPAADQRADLVGGELLAREHGEHTRRSGCCGGVEPLNARMCMRRADEGGIRLRRAIDVRGVLAGAGDEAKIFDAANGLADSGVGHGLLPYSAACGIGFFAIACAPAATALTMLW